VDVLVVEINAEAAFAEMLQLLRQNDMHEFQRQVRVDIALRFARHAPVAELWHNHTWSDPTRL